MLTGGMRESARRDVELHDMEPTTVEKMLLFVNVQGLRAPARARGVLRPAGRAAAREDPAGAHPAGRAADPGAGAHGGAGHVGRVARGERGQAARRLAGGHDGVRALPHHERQRPLRQSPAAGERRRHPRAPAHGSAFQPSQVGVADWYRSQEGQATCTHCLTAQAEARFIYAARHVRDHSTMRLVNETTCTQLPHTATTCGGEWTRPARREADVIIIKP
ncbi:hypothetical protein ON010_g12035 [Phytophthora cinnamomi]|nr:hypothetical protein ON010_g12035 [Phytophthora cinnamomi]